MSDSFPNSEIMLVEDEESIRRSLSRILAEAGHRVTTARSGEEALLLARKTAFDLVITDIRLPGMSGLEFLERLQDVMPGVVAIVMTGYADVDSAVDSLRLGAVDYVRKPSSSKSILASVERGLAKRAEELRRRELIEHITATVQALAGPVGGTAEQTHRVPASRLDSRQPKHIVTSGVIEIGRLCIDPRRYLAMVGERDLDLTPTEFELLLYLARKQDEVVQARELVQVVRGYETDDWEARALLRPHISNLRRKIGAPRSGLPQLLTVRGVGYLLTGLDRSGAT